MDKQAFVQAIKELCTGDRMPDHSLHKWGKLPEGWEEEYLSLLEANRNYWQNIENWPRDLFYCFYRVGLHHKYAYDEWAKKNGSNAETEISLHKVRLVTEAFIYGKPQDQWHKT